MSVVHITPGLLDIRAFTIFGLHAKPNTTNPIGKFGTGIKYAISTLLRLGCKVRVFIGTVEYEFYTSGGDFRGVEFEQVRMKERKGFLSKWRYTELPFTTQHGKFWEAWQAFRELESNTRDENGVTISVEHFSDVGVDNTTTIVITGEPYESAYMDRDKIFLPQALTKREGNDKVQVFNEPSDHLYWRGIRVYELDKPSIYTYNILSDMELTEDRTLKYMFMAQAALTGYVAKSKDTKLINAVVSAEGDKFFEGRWDFDYANESPSDEFKSVIAKKRSRGGYVSPRALTYYDKYTPVVASEKISLRSRIETFAYDDDVVEDLRTLLKYLLKCRIEEPDDASNGPDDFPF